MNTITKYPLKSKLVFFLFAYWHDPRWKKFVGATVKIRDLALNLSEMGHDVTLWVPRYDISLKGSSVRVIEIPFMDIPFLRSVSFKIGLFFYLLLFSITKIPDIVYERRMGSIMPAFYALLVNALFFYEVNDDPYVKVFHEGSFLGFKIRKAISTIQERINLRLCKRGFVITRKIIDKILTRNPGMDSDKFIELPSGANCELLKPMQTKRCRVENNLDTNRNYIGFTGTLLGHQGVETLIKASPLIIAERPGAMFLIIGEGPLKSSYRKVVKNLGVDGYFMFTGQIEYQKMPSWIGAMDVCVAPFLENAGYRSPVKIFDYMACGKPVVASKIEGTTISLKAVVQLNWCLQEIQKCFLRLLLVY